MKRIAGFLHKKAAFAFVALLLILIPFAAFAQQAANKGGNEVPFTTIVSTDAYNNYFAVNLTLLPGFFERAYMLDLIFSDPKLVINNTDISGSSLEVFSNRVNDTDQVVKSIENYRSQAIAAAKSMDEKQKNALLEKYNKYR